MARTTADPNQQSDKITRQPGEAPKDDGQQQREQIGVMFVVKPVNETVRSSMNSIIYLVGLVVVVLAVLSLIGLR